MNSEKEFEELTMFLEQIKNEVDFSDCKDFDDRMIFSILFCIKKAKQIEREACAKVCDEKVDAEYATGKVDHNEMGWTQACAIAIRARGQS